MRTFDVITPREAGNTINIRLTETFPGFAVLLNLYAQTDILNTDTLRFTKFQEALNKAMDTIQDFEKEPISPAAEETKG